MQLCFVKTATRSLPRATASRGRPNATVCKAVAISRNQWPLFENLQRLLRWNQDAKPVESIVEEKASLSGSFSQQKSGLLQEAKHNAVQVGLKLTGLAYRLAEIVVKDVRRSVAFVRGQSGVEQPSRASQLMMNVQEQLTRKAHRENLQLQGKDAAFMQMLHSLDRCHMDLDSKWASVVEHTADKAEFSERLQHLYRLAKDSKSAVDTLLRPDATRREINTFWKSEETKSLIAEEDALKQLVFAQMLQASS